MRTAQDFDPFNRPERSRRNTARYEGAINKIRGVGFAANGWRKLEGGRQEDATPPADLEGMNEEAAKRAKELEAKRAMEAQDNSNETLPLAPAVPPMPPQKLINELIPTEARYGKCAMGTSYFEGGGGESLKLLRLALSGLKC